MPKSTQPFEFAASLSTAAQHVAQRLDAALGAILGLSFAEFRIIAALADRPGARASRVELARAVGLTPSGITRALKPMEKLGIVVTVKSKRDARLAIAGLTPAGRELYNGAAAIVAESMDDIAGRAGLTSAELRAAINLMTRLSR